MLTPTTKEMLVTATGGRSAIHSLYARQLLPALARSGLCQFPPAAVGLRLALARRRQLLGDPQAALVPACEPRLSLLKLKLVSAVYTPALAENETPPSTERTEKAGFKTTTVTKEEPQRREKA